MVGQLFHKNWESKLSAHPALIYSNEQWHKVKYSYRSNGLNLGEVELQYLCVYCTRYFIATNFKVPVAFFKIFPLYTGKYCKLLEYDKLLKTPLNSVQHLRWLIENSSTNLNFPNGKEQDNDPVMSPIMFLKARFAHTVPCCK